MTPIARLMQAMKSTTNEESGNKALTMRPRDSDIFVVTYPKSGTTWVQNILYQMSSRGDMGFREISDVVPWVERAHFLGQDVEVMPSPRLFKSHLDYRSTPKGPCKYIYVLRDGRDVAVSFHQFIMARYGEGEDIPFENFFLEFFVVGAIYGSWFSHVKEWWKHRHDENVLVMTYEDMKDDLEHAVDMIAEFSGFELDADLRRTVMDHSSFEFMKQHESQFGEAVVTRGAGRVSKVRAGKVGSHRALMTPEITKAYLQEFERQMAEIGIERYEDFRAALHSKE